MGAPDGGSRNRMTNGMRVLVRAVTGLIVGVCVVFIAVAVTLMLSFSTSAAVGIPGLIDVWTSQENGANAVDFEPSVVGMAVAAVVIAAVYTVLVRPAARPL